MVPTSARRRIVIIKMLIDYSTGWVAPRRRIEKKTTSQSSAKAPSLCGGVDAGGSVGLHSMQNPICNVSEYAEVLQRCIRKAWSLICRVIL